MFLPIVPLKISKSAALKNPTWAAEPQPSRSLWASKTNRRSRATSHTFIRSDQYNFIRHGVPAVKWRRRLRAWLTRAKIFKDWLTNRYHAPSDDVNQPVDLQSRGKLRGVYAPLAPRDCQHSRAAALEAGFFLPAIRCRLMPIFLKRGRARGSA